jgi:hypothetical protein
VAKSIAPRGARPAAQPKAPKIKTAVCLSDEAMRRLGLACVDLRMDQSEIVEWLIHQALSGYVLSVRGDRPRIGKSDGQPNLPASVMADESANGASHVNSPSLVGL